MENQILNNPQYKTIKSFFKISQFSFIFLLISLILFIISDIYSMPQNYIPELFYLSEIFIFINIVFSNSIKRQKIIFIGFTFYTIFSFLTSVDILFLGLDSLSNMEITRFILLFLNNIFLLTLILLLYKKNKKPGTHNIKIICWGYIITLFAALICKFFTYSSGQYYLIVNIASSFIGLFFPIILAFIIYKGITDEVFLNNFFINNPKHLKSKDLTSTSSSRINLELNKKATRMYILSIIMLGINSLLTFLSYSYSNITSMLFYLFNIVLIILLIFAYGPGRRYIIVGFFLSWVTIAIISQIMVLINTISLFVSSASQILNSMFFIAELSLLVLTAILIHYLYRKIRLKKAVMNVSNRVFIYFIILFIFLCNIVILMYRLEEISFGSLLGTILNLVNICFITVITFNGLKDESFYKNFIEAHPYLT